MDPSVLHHPRLRIILLIGLLLLTGADVHASALHCRVVDVVSGDTFFAQCTGSRVEVRLDGVEGPGQQALFRDRARRNLSDLLLEHEVDLDVAGFDDGVLVSRVYLGKTDVNARLVADGMAECGSLSAVGAWCAPAQAQARSAMRGLWSDPWKDVGEQVSPVYVPRPLVADVIPAKASTQPPKRRSALKL